MKSKTIFRIACFLIAILFFLSCHKETDYRRGVANTPPIANAGPDQTISLPVNSITLDASGSTDVDNNISSYLWTKIAGPLSYTIANASAVQTQVKNLVEGTYWFELTVTDAGGLSSKDTVIVKVLLSPSGELILDNYWWDDDYSKKTVHTNAIVLPAGYSVSNIKNVYLHNGFWTSYWFRIEKDGIDERVFYYHVDNSNNSIIVYWYYYNTPPDYVELAFPPDKIKIEFN